MRFRGEIVRVARIVRPMKKDVDGLPLVGTKGNCLGVRPLSDVDLIPLGDENGAVIERLRIVRKRRLENPAAASYPRTPR